VIDTATIERIDYLYRRTRLTPLLTVLGVFIPIVFICLVPLSLLYLFQRRQLLRELSGNSIDETLGNVSPGEPSITHKIEFVRARKWLLLVPSFIFAIYFACAVYSIVTIIANDPGAEKVTATKYR
jgi:hypothetical protein